MSYKGPLSFVCLFITLNIALAQVPTVGVPKISADKGSLIFSEVKVSHFNKIVGLQFSLTWDPEIIAFKGVSDFGMDLSQAVNFGIEQIMEGKLIFSWYDATLIGVTLPNETTVFKMEFEVIGDNLTSTSLIFGDDPAPREIVDTSYRAIQGTFTHGEITVLGISSGFFNRTIDQKVKIYPNPMDEVSGIEIEVETDKNIIIDIIDQQGRLVNRQKNRLNAGKQNIPLYREIVSGQGLYRVVISGENFFSTQNLMVR